MKLIKTIISKVSLISFISLVSFVSFVSSCSKSDDLDGGLDLNAPGVALGGVSGYSTYFEENIQPTRSGDALTRAWAIPSGYEAYEGGVQPIAIAFAETNMDKSKLMGHFYKREDKDLWLTNVEFEASHDYYLYGFIPNLPVIKYSITDRNPGLDDDSDDKTVPEHDGYSHGAIMSLEDVPTVMPNDLCVVIGAKHGTDKEHDSGLRRGDFSFRTSQGTDGKDYVFLLFDHLYASLKVRMKVHEDYAELRTIKLKSLQLGTIAGNDTTTKSTNVIIRLQSTDGSDPIESISFTPTDGSSVNKGDMEFWSDPAGHTLTTAYQSFIGHFMPTGITKFTLTSIYDVYDNNVTPEHPEGNLIRKDCKATNSVLLSDLFTGQTYTERGKRYIIDMTIQPTFLHMLSEPDLNDPEVIIN